MLKVTAILLLCLAVSGCVTTRGSAKPLGVKVGDDLILRVDAVLVTCQESQSTAALWFSPPAEARCLSQLSDSSSVPLSPVFPAGDRFSIARIKFVNGIDDTHFLVYVVAARANTKDQLLVEDYEFSKLFRLAQVDEP